MNNIGNILKEDCCGCSACAMKCPKGCITMVADAMGFWNPQIDDSQCVQCGLCLKVCAANYEQKNENNGFEQIIYAARHKTDSVLTSSSSGGVFTALSDCIIDHGGVVAGSIYDDNCMSVHHAFAETKAERDQMKGSKYTYSFCGPDFLVSVESYLKSGRKVLFTGTPCQVAALKNYVGDKFPNLYTCDLLCHGVESPSVYKDFVKEMSRNNTVTRIDFRKPMHDNWHEARTVVHYANGKSKSNSHTRAYYMIFVQDYGLRPSCLHCDYCSFERCGDITIGDFHGIESTPLRSFDHPMGCSVVLVNSPKGESLFQEASKSLNVLQSQKNHCTHNQLNGLPNIPPIKENEFEKDYLAKGWEYVKWKYGMPSLKIRVLETLYSHPWIWKIRNLLKH